MTGLAISILIAARFTYYPANMITPAHRNGTLATASRIKGSKLTIMSGMGHFPMSENPQLFRQHLLPLLEEIAG